MSYGAVAYLQFESLFGTQPELVAVPPSCTAATIFVEVKGVRSIGLNTFIVGETQRDSKCQGMIAKADIEFEKPQGSPGNMLLRMIMLLLLLFFHDVFVVRSPFVRPELLDTDRLLRDETFVLR